MVAEALPAVEEAQIPPVEEVAPPSPPELETPVAEEPTELDTSTEEFLRGLGSEEAAVPGQDQPPADLPPELQAKVDAGIAEVFTDQQRQQRELGVLNAFRDSATNLRGWAASQGLPPQEIDRLAEFFNQYHNVGQQVVKREASEAAAVTTVSQFYDAMAKELPASKRPGFLAARGVEHKDQASTVKAFLSVAREGYLTKKEATDLAVAAVTKYRKEVVDPAMGKAPPQSGGGISPSSSADNIKLSNPNTPLAEIEAIRARQRRADG